MVDGSLLPTLPQLVEAMWQNEKNRAFKMHTHFELLKGVPVRMDLTDANTDERDVLATGHTSRGGPEQGDSLLIVSDLLDVPAEQIALMYKHRWAIETFFRFFKHVLGCRHLISHCTNGIEIQTYLGIIACLLIALWTGRKPTLRTCEMICHSFAGLASEEELLRHIQKTPTVARPASYA